MSIDRETWRKIGIVLIVVGGILLVIWGVRIYTATRSLVGHARQAQALLSGDPVEILRENPELPGQLILGVREDFVSLKQTVGWLAPVGRVFGWLPKVGPLLANAPEWLVVADGFTEAGVILWEGFSPTVAAWLDGEPVTQALNASFEPGAPDLAPAGDAVHRARLALEKIDLAVLPDEYEPLAVQFRELLPLVEDGLGLVEFAPELLGLDTPQTYLALALNDVELRPGGGFITAVGEVQIQAGEILTMTFADSYRVDDFSQPYPDPPEMMRRFLNVDLWVFRDSNWSPDFPTSVAQGLELYRPKHPVDVNGVVALDMWAVQEVIGAVEPLTVSGFDEPVMGDSVMDYVYKLWKPDEGETLGEWWGQRKSFMAPLGFAVLDRIQSGDVDWLKLLQTILTLLDERHLMVYLDEPEVEAFLVEQGWGGALAEPSGDYVMPVEANLGFNKVSANIERAFEYEVDLSTVPYRAKLTLVYTNTGTADIACIPEARYDATYEQMMDRCYWNALRVYVPEGAELSYSSRHPIPAKSVASGVGWDGKAYVTDAPEGDYTVFNQALLLPTDYHRKVSFEYTLPESIITQDDESLTYTLDIQKQAGILSVPVRVILHLPQNAVLLSLQPEQVSGDDVTLFFDLNLNMDRQVVVRYRE
ncbi:MAG: DUF4012 domain-containing protein [Anaerolineae bacterium]|nr:DUF4012 domain-containing protein [Anaerolineae bacterium]